MNEPDESASRMKARCEKPSESASRMKARCEKPSESASRMKAQCSVKISDTNIEPVSYTHLLYDRLISSDDAQSEDESEDKEK